MNAIKYPYAEHDDGIILEQPKPGKFTRTPMTPAQLAARDPALAIAKDIYRHANQAGVCYIELWEVIAKAIQGALTSLSAQLAEQEGYPGIAHDFGLAKIALEQKVALLAQADARIASLEADLARARELLQSWCDLCGNVEQTRKFIGERKP